jgi:hypothetical protein
MSYRCRLTDGLHDGSPHPGGQRERDCRLHENLQHDFLWMLRNSNHRDCAIRSTLCTKPVSPSEARRESGAGWALLTSGRRGGHHERLQETAPLGGTPRPDFKRRYWTFREPGGVIEPGTLRPRRRLGARAWLVFLEFFQDRTRSCRVVKLGRYFSCSSILRR